MSVFLRCVSVQVWIYIQVVELNSQVVELNSILCCIFILVICSATVLYEKHMELVVLGGKLREVYAEEGSAPGCGRLIYRVF